MVRMALRIREYRNGLVGDRFWHELLHARMIVRAFLEFGVPAGRARDQRHDRAATIAARSPFLRLVAAGVDREGRRAASRGEVGAPRIISDHQIRRADDFRGSKPIAGAGNIGDAGVPSILLQDPLELAMLRAGSDENDTTTRSVEQQ